MLEIKWLKYTWSTPGNECKIGLDGLNIHMTFTTLKETVELVSKIICKFISEKQMISMEYVKNAYYIVCKQ